MAFLLYIYFFAILLFAFTAEIIDGKPPSEAIFNVPVMRKHLITCLENEKLTPFPNNV